jgi:protein CMS1
MVSRTQTSNSLLSGQPLSNLYLLWSVGALSIKNLKRIVVDASHIDQKKRGVMDMKDTVVPLAQFIARKEFKERYAMEDEPLDLIFF